MAVYLCQPIQIVVDLIVVYLGQSIELVVDLSVVHLDQSIKLVDDPLDVCRGPRTQSRFTGSLNKPVVDAIHFVHVLDHVDVVLICIRSPRAETRYRGIDLKVAIIVLIDDLATLVRHISLDASRSTRNYCNTCRNRGSR